MALYGTKSRCTHLDFSLFLAVIPNILDFEWSSLEHLLLQFPPLDTLTPTTSFLDIRTIYKTRFFYCTWYVTRSTVILQMVYIFIVWQIKPSKRIYFSLFRFPSNINFLLTSFLTQIHAIKYPPSSFPSF